MSCYYTAFQKYDDVINALQSILTDGASKSSFTPGVVNIALVGMESVDPKVKWSYDYDVNSACKLRFNCVSSF